MRIRRILVVMCVLMMGIGLTSVHAHDPHQHGSQKSEEEHGTFNARTVRILHFAHPLIGESPTPDNKHRFDFEFQNQGRQDRYSGIYTLEYLLTPGVSTEIEVPYTSVDPDNGPDQENLDNITAELKIANPWFSGRNLLLVHGLGLGIPTGDEGEGIGSNNIWELEGVLGFGYKPAPRWEIVGFAELGIPFNQDRDQEVEAELGWNLSLLRHLTPRWQGLLELDGETVLSSEEVEEDGRDVMNLSPGVKYRIDSGKHHAPSHWVGGSVGFPISGPEDFDTRWKVSYFYHF